MYNFLLFSKKSMIDLRMREKIEKGLGVEIFLIQL